MRGVLGAARNKGSLGDLLMNSLDSAASLEHGRCPITESAGGGVNGLGRRWSGGRGS